MAMRIPIIEIADDRDGLGLWRKAEEIDRLGHAFTRVPAVRAVRASRTVCVQRLHLFRHTRGKSHVSGMLG